MEDSQQGTINPYLIDAEELLERAFSKASDAAESENVSGLRPIVKARIKEKIRLRTSSARICHALSKAAKAIPPRSTMSPFLIELLDAMGAAGLSEARSDIGRSLRAVRSITDRSLSKMDGARSTQSLQTIRRAAYGRISSKVRSLKPAFAYLREMAPLMKELPSLKAGSPTVVIAGYPNVGKTTLLKALTGSAPEIRPIPFTTKRIQLGYYPWRWQDVQVIDTPGLLDRPDEERNPAERKAVGALRHLPDVVIFMVDPTTIGGFTLDSQLNLLAQIRESFPKPLIVALNKIDIADDAQLKEAGSLLNGYRTVQVSSLSGTGIEELREAISSYLIEIAAHGEG